MLKKIKKNDTKKKMKTNLEISLFHLVLFFNKPKRTRKI